MVGAKLADDGCFLCDDHQRTSVAGLYAAGDVVHGLDQIGHAMGEGGVAATTIRNDLCADEPRWREPAGHAELVSASIAETGAAGGKNGS
jgi:Thioredoxin reductase